VCINTIGSFTCSCNAGFRLNSNGISCDDINECQENTDGCAQLCTNTIGSFACGCNSGYRLSSDGRSCPGT
jgi:fibulin 1/2